MDDKKYVRVIFQLEPDRHEFIKREAEKRGLSISQYLRNLVREKFYSGRFTSMYEEQRQERLNDGFERDHLATWDKLRGKSKEDALAMIDSIQTPRKKYDSLTGRPL